MSDTSRYMGFSLNWGFSDFLNTSNFIGPEASNQTWNPFDDLFKTLKVLIEEQLLLPKYYLYDNREIQFNEKNLEEIIFALQNQYKTKDITTEILRIGGVGYVILENDEMLKVENLVTIDMFRFFERSFLISTAKDIWVPLSMNFEWQIQVAEKNAPRLTRALVNIENSLGVIIDPRDDEIDNEYPIWQRGKYFFNNPQILRDEFQINPPEVNFDCEGYLSQFI